MKFIAGFILMGFLWLCNIAWPYHHTLAVNLYTDKQTLHAFKTDDDARNFIAVWGN